jgi:hypothetical protein
MTNDLEIIVTGGTGAHLSKYNTQKYKPWDDCVTTKIENQNTKIQNKIETGFYRADLLASGIFL